MGNKAKNGSRNKTNKKETGMFTDAYVKSITVGYADNPASICLTLSPASGYSFSSKTDKDEKSYLLFVEDGSKDKKAACLLSEDTIFISSKNSAEKMFTDAFLLTLKTQHVKCRFEISEVTDQKQKAIALKGLTVC